MKHLIKHNADWLIVTALLVLTVIVTSVVTAYVNRPDHQYATPTTSTRNNYLDDTLSRGIYYSPPPDKQYPVSGSQRKFYVTYTAGDVQYNIAKGALNVSRVPNGGDDTFYLSLYNYTNQTVTPSGKDLEAISIGCIAEDQPYHSVSVKVQPVTLGPFETKNILLEVPYTCMYIGTADSQYFWRVYL